MRNAHAALLTALALTLSAASARASICPDGPDPWNTYGKTDVVASWDQYFARLWCGEFQNGAASIPDSARRQAVLEHALSTLPFDDDYQHWWDVFVADTALCDPDTWGMRYFNGLYFLDYLGDVRATTPVPHGLTPEYIYDGHPVTHWMIDFVGVAEDDDVRYGCLDEDDAPGTADGYTSAANGPEVDTILYYPWFWIQTVPDRAGTLAHEAAHEYHLHLDESECTAHASCDGAYNAGEANAQTVHVFFLAQAVDAWLTTDGEPEIARFADSTCGYVPLLSKATRDTARETMDTKLTTHFKHVPAVADRPLAAQRTTVTLGTSAEAYNSLDLAINARWPCVHVCALVDYDFGLHGKSACDESLRALNAEVNADNRALCQQLRSQVGDGATPTELAIYAEQLQLGLRACVPGVDDAVVEAHCDDVIAGAGHVTDIAADWHIADQGYHFDAQAAITACEQRYCDGLPHEGWQADAQAACYEWDDPFGCLTRACGDLATVGPRESSDYLQAVACRADAIAEGFAGAFAVESPCGAQYARCVTNSRHLADWQAYVAGGMCWHDGSPSIFAGDAIDGLGTETYDDFVNSAGLASFADGCLIQHTACRAQAGLAVKYLGELALDQIREDDARWKPDLPDAWQSRTQRFTRELFEELADLADAYPVIEGPPIHARRVRALARPDARVAMAAIAGHDTWFRLMGEAGADAAFAPRRLEAHARRGEPDPNAPPDRLDAAVIERLVTLRERAERVVADAPPGAFGRGNAARIHAALGLIADARDDVQLERALIALEGSIGAN